MAETIQLSFVVHRAIYLSLSKEMTNHPLKGRGLAHVTHFACTTVDLKNRHGTPLTEINDVVDDGPLFLSPTARCCRYTKAQAPSVRFLVYLLRTWLYNTSTTNRPSIVWALPCMYLLITDRWRSVL